jgi:geranylgeranyl diphosphate synthase type I
MTLDISPPHSGHKTADLIVARSRQLVDPALREVVAQLHPWPGLMAAFSFGWCEVDGTPREAHSGKGLRPAIAVLSAEGAGGAPETAVTGAVAVELVHAFSLIHDDIMDGDELRRHRETVWKAYGVGPAVLAGDALLALAMDTLTGAEGATPALGAEMSRALVDLVHGQAEDVAFESRPWSGPGAVTPEEYRAMASRKTGSLLGCAAALGTLLGGGSPELGAAMSLMGRHLGVAFQAVDDLLGICGDPAATGKPVFSDLRRGKKTLPVVAAIAGGTEPGRRLAEILGSGAKDEGVPKDEDVLREAATLIEEAGGLSYAREQADLYLGRASHILDTAGLDPTAAGELMILADFLVRRTH